MSTITLVQIALASLIAGGIDTVAGFGGGLLLIPILVLVVGSRDAVLLAALVPLGWNLPRLLLMRQWVRWGMAMLFTIGIIPGTFLGAHLLGVVDAGLLRMIIGVLLIVAGVYFVVRIYVPMPGYSGLRPWALPVAGFVSGVVGGLLGAGHGPLQSGALAATALNVREIAATNGALGAISALARILGYGSQGMFHSELWLPGLVGMIFAAVGSVGGIRLSRRAKDATLELLVSVVILLAGLRMVLAGL